MSVGAASGKSVGADGGRAAEPHHVGHIFTLRRGTAGRQLRFYAVKQLRFIRIETACKYRILETSGAENERARGCSPTSGFLWYDT